MFHMAATLVIKSTERQPIALTNNSISDSLQIVLGSPPRTVTGVRPLRIPQNNECILDFLRLWQKNTIKTYGSGIALQYVK